MKTPDFAEVGMGRHLGAHTGEKDLRVIGYKHMFSQFLSAPHDSPLYLEVIDATSSWAFGSCFVIAVFSSPALLISTDLGGKQFFFPVVVEFQETIKVRIS